MYTPPPYSGYNFSPLTGDVYKCRLVYLNDIYLKLSTVVTCSKIGKKNVSEKLANLSQTQNLAFENYKTFLSKQLMWFYSENLEMSSRYWIHYWMNFPLVCIYRVAHWYNSERLSESNDYHSYDMSHILSSQNKPCPKKRKL